VYANGGYTGLRDVGPGQGGAKTKNIAATR